ncbi:N-acetylmuramoyl-L-alanine amidase [Psychrobacillus sp. AK 1817]|uniref:N-acetylmuramoyl-L-alanine amidase family protein n=1 Tax=Psychrobacillus sp. AK 1817 TaxID=2303505 RepID=UPI0012490FE3|nr:N-acetylmuramoyl-L-alanine amidase [Psychrobacillus sp. AK 1817]QEY22392.1 N-acetylmuramoyl-L-alanine amidase [Psychrobacillus sp. AK 1817]QGM29278.1 N-acetylmuramoyl-L-alanine amidase [Bacillus sp. N3536]
MRIILDAGHGPETAGKRTPDGKMKEFEFNSAVTRLVKKELDNTGIVVIFSHSDDVDVPLRERTSLANKLKVQAFISIHANAYGSNWNEVNGIETYTYLKPSADSILLAKHIQESLCISVERKNRGVKQKNLAVVRDTIMPAVLVECGFMTNKEEARLLQSEEYRLKCAQGIATGIKIWVKNKN